MRRASVRSARAGRHTQWGSERRLLFFLLSFPLHTFFPYLSPVHLVSVLRSAVVSPLRSRPSTSPFVRAAGSHIPDTGDSRTTYLRSDLRFFAQRIGRSSSYGRPMSDEIEKVAEAHDEVVRARRAERTSVHVARASGTTWAEIAGALRCSLSAAHRVYGASAPAPGRSIGRSVDECVARIAAAHDAVVDATVTERTAVHAARGSGATWAEVARALRCRTRVAAYRYGEGSPAPARLLGRSVDEHAERIELSASYIRNHLDLFPHTIADYRGRKRIRILPGGHG